MSPSRKRKLSENSAISSGKDDAEVEVSEIEEASDEEDEEEDGESESSDDVDPPTPLALGRVKRVTAGTDITVFRFMSLVIPD